MGENKPKNRPLNRDPNRGTKQHRKTDKKEPRKNDFFSHCKKGGKTLLKFLVKAIYMIGLFVLGIWDGFEEKGGFGKIFGAFGRGIKRAASFVGAWVFVLLKKIAHFFRHIADMVQRRWKERRHYTLKVRSLAILTGAHAADIHLPFTEEEKAVALHKGMRRLVRICVPLLAVLAVSMIIYTAKSYVLGVRVQVDGKEIGVLASEEKYTDLVKEAETYIESVTGEPYEVKLVPDFRAAFVKRSDTENTTAIKDRIYSEATDVISETYGLYIDGQIIATNMNGQGIRDQLQKKLEKAGTGDPTERVEFIQAVEVKKGLLPKTLERSLIEIDDLLSESAVMEQTYAVVRGDTLSQIAERFGMTLSALQNLNPEVNPNTMREGTKLIVQSAQSRLSVKLIRTVTYTEEIPYETEKISTESLYQNQTKLQVAGVLGEVSVTADVVYIEGKETERVELSREIVREPVNAEMLVGTKKLPEKVATGNMRRPVGGIISSNYGVWRGSSRHTGVDFANPTGTPIVAADGGKVISAGWSGSYGYAIVIDHGNGLKTRYAHCSKLLVSAGESVAKGQTIARVGSTGNSTGPHLHFEVIKNGSFVNPFNYV